MLRRRVPPLSALAAPVLVPEDTAVEDEVRESVEDRFYSCKEFSMPNLQDPRTSFRYVSPTYAVAPLAQLPGLVHQTAEVNTSSRRSPSPPHGRPLSSHHPGPLDLVPVGRGPNIGGSGEARASSPPSPIGGGRTSGISQHRQHAHQQPQPPQQQLLPPTCGARQLSKLKRFLTTLQQFAVDISPETGEHVRSLVLALVNSQLSIEEFHGKLQQATNFPLRPFVIPFLKANLPLLQREMLHCAQLARQSPHHYVATYNDRVMLDAVNAAAAGGGCLAPPPAITAAAMTSPCSTAVDQSRASQAGQSPNATGVKRKSSSIRGEQLYNVDSSSDAAEKVKRPRTATSQGSSSCSPPPSNGRQATEHRHDDEIMIQPRDVTSLAVADRHYDNTRISQSSRGVDDDVDNSTDLIVGNLKHVEHLLVSVVGMVDQCKMAITGLREQWTLLSIPRVGESPLTGISQRTVAEAVNEVKCKAIHEIQKIIAESEAKTERLVAAERARLDVAVAAARQQALDELRQSNMSQHNSSEACWNCGRKATETCSGCNVACYCGSFCQHRDWISHQLVCRRSSSSGSAHPPAGTRLRSQNDTNNTGDIRQTSNIGLDGDDTTREGDADERCGSSGTVAAADDNSNDTLCLVKSEQS